MSRNEFIGIAEMKVTGDPESVLIAPNLGSCVAVSVFDPATRRGGMIHCLLPLSNSDPEKAKLNPAMYVDVGVPRLLESVLSGGSDKKKLIIIAAGGANINDDRNVFEIGKKNSTVLKKIMWKNNLLFRAESFGEDYSRTLSLDIQTGKTYLKAKGVTTEL